MEVAAGIGTRGHVAGMLVVLLVAKGLRSLVAKENMRQKQIGDPVQLGKVAHDSLLQAPVRNPRAKPAGPGRGQGTCFCRHRKHPIFFKMLPVYRTQILQCFCKMASDGLWTPPLSHPC